MKTRFGLFLSLPLASIDKMALSTRLREIGQSAGASSNPPGVA
jgi:arsenate reductase